MDARAVCTTARTFCSSLFQVQSQHVSVFFDAFSMMYWTDWGASPKIEKAEMDGSMRQAIVSGNLVWPNGLTIDQVTNRLFWADAKLDKIEASDLTGKNRQLILSSGNNIHPFGLVVYNEMLYWTDWNTTSVSRFNLTSGSQDLIVTGLQLPADIHVSDPSLIFSGRTFAFRPSSTWYINLK